MDSYSGTKRDLDSSYDGGSSKRHKQTSEGSTPSKVLHVRGLPPYTTEAELVTVCNPFGSVIKTLLLNSKQQAFVQMDSVEAATTLVSRYASSPAYIRSKPVHFQFSNRNEVKTNSNNSSSSSSGGGGGSSSLDGGQSQTPNNVLLVSVINARVPVTLDNIHQIFKPYGEVLKIITFVKDTIFKALVQMATVEQAINAKLLLEGKDMFQGCCHLRIGFSKLTDLKVKQNGPRSRDFTVPDYTSLQMTSGVGQGYLFPPSGGLGPGFGFDLKGGSYSSGSAAGSFPFEGGAQKGCVLLVNNLTPDKITADKLFILFGVYGDVLRVKILFNKRDTAMIQFASPQGAHLAHLHLNHLFLHSKEITVSPSKHIEISLPRGDTEESSTLTKDFTNSKIHRYKNSATRNSKNINPPSQVLHISNIPPTVNEEDLRKLFGEEQTGAAAVQFFSSDKKMAYVKMDSVHDAVLALIRLHNYKFGDRQYMRVSFSHKDPSQVTNSDTGESATTGTQDPELT